MKYWRNLTVDFYIIDLSTDVKKKKYIVIKLLIFNCFTIIFFTVASFIVLFYNFDCSVLYT